MADSVRLSSVAVNCPGAACTVFADPAGHPFCLTTWDDV
jgi:hypothetical protein